ncbi:helix-turn-helix domain-containing protein [Candidatus Leptofilum sp.]|uniref:helix-turn-helix domain-containing protein n=1 Tax=Candidatus Leptofilum sp. TaxID=3241576 RepID=UPI003B596EF9
MIAPINHQIIEKDGKPLFVLVPYDEYLSLVEHEDATTIPQAVVEKHILEEMSLIRAWREYLSLSQKDVAQKAGISQSAYSQMEKPKANLRRTTINKIARALGIAPEQLAV